MSRVGKFLFSFAIFCVICYGALTWFVNDQVEKGFNEAVSKVDGLSVTYDDLWVDLGEQTVTLTDVDTVLPSGQKLTADTVIVYAFDEKNPFPHFIKAQAEGLVLSPSSMNMIGIPATVYGVGKVTGDLLLDYRYNPEAKSLTLNTLTYDMDGVAKAELSGTMTQLDLDAFRVEKLIGLQIKDATFRYLDRTLVDEILTKAGGSLGVSKEDARKQVSAELATLAKGANADGNSVAAEALDGFRHFVENPGRLVVTASPDKPVPYLYFFMGRNLYENIRLMNVTVENRIEVAN